MKTLKPGTNTHNTPAAAPSAAPNRVPTEPRRYKRVKGLPALVQSTKGAAQALRANVLRSLLTSLGIIIGVGAVIMMISISEGNAAVINQRLSTLNPLQLTIRPGSSRGPGNANRGAGTQQTLTQADADSIAQLPNVAAVSPVASVSGQLVNGSQNWQTNVQGVYPSYQQINSWQMQEGSFIGQSDEQERRNTAVLGQTVVQNLFPPGTDALGQQIRINNVSFTVIGTLVAKGSSGFGNNADDVVYVPFSTGLQRLSRTQSVNNVVLIASSTSTVNTVQNATQQLLEQRHHITNSLQDDFTIQNLSQVLGTVQASNQSLTILLVSVAAISLVVGGIGIMNIMLVSVTERTREIGIRIAVGARPRDVMTQFLIEALALSVLGGAIGVLLGPLGTVLMARANGFPFVLDPLSVLIAFGVAAIVGVVFGFYPAQRAARLDPIVALRTE
ncbi:MAG: ABC transporter permease [Chloroflexota bacterium]|nr:ABC transporter permease [Chloroflexota bacterium]